MKHFLVSILPIAIGIGYAASVAVSVLVLWVGSRLWKAAARPTDISVRLLVRSLPMPMNLCILLLIFLIFCELTPVVVRCALIVTNYLGWTKTLSDSSEEVTIPFQNDHGMIIVTAQIGEKTLDCVVDSGIGPILWQGDTLGAHLFGSLEPHYYTYTGRQQFDTYRAQMPPIRLGNYCLNNVQGRYYPHPPRSYLVKTKSGRIVQMVLGNRAFRDATLTIDYRRSVLILRHHGSPTLQAANDGSIPFTFESNYHENADWPYGIYVAGTLENCPVTFVVDTGHTDQAFECGFSLKTKLPDRISYQLMKRGIYGVSGVLFRMVSDVPLKWRIGDLQGQTYTVFADDNAVIPDDVVYLGYDFLKKYRVVIDYPRHKLFLQPDQ